MRAVVGGGGGVLPESSSCPVDCLRSRLDEHTVSCVFWPLTDVVMGIISIVCVGLVSLARVLVPLHLCTPADLDPRELRAAGCHSGDERIYAP